MQHDTELSGCLERWQLCGDALRGQARVPARPVLRPYRAALQPSRAIRLHARTSRVVGKLARWGGGALAVRLPPSPCSWCASRFPMEAPVQVAPPMASQAPPARTKQLPPTRVCKAPPTVTAASDAVASLPRRQNEVRRSATRNRRRHARRRWGSFPIARLHPPRRNGHCAIASPVIAAGARQLALRRSFLERADKSYGCRALAARRTAANSAKAGFNAGYSIDSAAHVSIRRGHACRKVHQYRRQRRIARLISKRGRSAASLDPAPPPPFANPIRGMRSSTSSVRNSLLGLLILTSPLAACAQQPASTAAASAPAVTGSIAKAALRRSSRSAGFTRLVEQVGPGVVNVKPGGDQAGRTRAGRRTRPCGVATCRSSTAHFRPDFQMPGPQQGPRGAARRAVPRWAVAHHLARRLPLDQPPCGRWCR